MELSKHIKSKKSTLRTFKNQTFKKR
jgi:hypothetical protein